MTIAQTASLIHSRHGTILVAVPTDPTALLRGHGIQVTAQRLAVLRAVASQPHVAADAVAEIVRSEIGTISLQSVYDTLSLFVVEGLVRRIQPAGSPARFEARTGDNHHHLICRSCGRVVDVDCAVGPAPCLVPIDGHGYEIDEAEVAYWGRCPDCLKDAPAMSRHGIPAVGRPRRQPQAVDGQPVATAHSRTETLRTRATTTGRTAGPAGTEKYGQDKRKR